MLVECFLFSSAFPLEYSFDSGVAIFILFWLLALLVQKIYQYGMVFKYDMFVCYWLFFKFLSFILSRNIWIFIQ